MSSDAPLEGLLPLAKPVGPSSHDIVAFTRSRLGVRRVGHTGTLDPFACGLLLLCLNRATRLAEYLQPLAKQYEACARLGVATATDDLEGQPVATSEGWRRVSRRQVLDTLTEFVGTSEQRPPDFSAKKVRGRTAYSRARRGEPIELTPVRVTVHRIELLTFDLPEVRFRVQCSAGTYIRALARDLGERLGVGAHLTQLRRTAIGPFRVQDALRPTDLHDPIAVRRALISPLDAVSHLPRLEVGPEEAIQLQAGRSVPVATGIPGGWDEDHAVTVEGRLLAIAVRDPRGLRPKKVFPLG